MSELNRLKQKELAELVEGKAGDRSFTLSDLIREERIADDTPITDPKQALTEDILAKIGGEITAETRAKIKAELTPGEKEEINKGLELKQWDRYIKAQKETLK